MNRKGMEMVPATIVTLALLVLVFFVYLALFRPTASEAGTFFSTETLKAKDSKCLFDGQRASEKGTKFADTDNDGRPDACDICFSYTTKKGSNDEDNDLDGMPTYCDKDDNDRTIVACKFSITKDGRCVEGGPPS